MINDTQIESIIKGMMVFFMSFSGLLYSLETLIACSFKRERIGYINALKRLALRNKEVD